jgi:hypothetical protein
MSAQVPTPQSTPHPSHAGARADAPAREEPASANGSADGDRAERPAPRSRERQRSRWAPSPTISRRELAYAFLAGLALAVITSWPLVLHMQSRIAPDLGDPVRTAWEVAWVGHAMLHDPLHLFNANVFYPHPLSLAFSDSLLGYGPAALFGSGTVAALVRYNLLFLFAWTLCFFGAYLLARELGLGRVAGAAAGAAFAYAPYRVTEAGHLHVISSGGIALALFLLLRGYRRTSQEGSRGALALVAAGWLVAAWQISLGFTLGLQFAYLLAVLAVILVVYRWRSDRRLPHRRMLAVTCAGLALVGAVTVYQARPYLKVSHDYPTAKRTLKEVKAYSAGPIAWFAASSENRVWGDLSSTLRAEVHSKNESVFFPGGLILVLAAAGLASPVFTRRLRLGLVVAIVVVSVLALGLSLTGAGYPYRILYDYAPGWNGVRVPGRVFTLATLAYALLAGAGVQLLAARAGAWGRRRSLAAGAGAWGRRRSLRFAGLVAGAALAAAIVGEGAGHLGHPVVPQPVRAEIGLPGPRLDLPTDGAADRVWQYFSTDGFYKIPIGNSTFDIPRVDDLRGGMNGFPDRASVEKLRYYGIRTVVLHLKLPKLPGIVGYAYPEPPNVAAAAAKPVAGLGITRRQVGSIVIYSIGPGPKALHGSN